MAAPPAVVNVLRPEGKFAVIGPGGGIDVLRALVSGSRDVTAIEINPIIANDIMRQRYADYSYRLYDRPEVRLRVSDGRSFIRSSQEQYDVLQMTLVDTWASTAAGAFALSEPDAGTDAAAGAIDSVLGLLASRYTLWWTNGSDRVKPSFVFAESLPSVERFAALLDGKWEQWGWKTR